MLRRHLEGFPGHGVEYGSDPLADCEPGQGCKIQFVSGNELSRQPQELRTIQALKHADGNNKLFLRECFGGGGGEVVWGRRFPDNYPGTTAIRNIQQPIVQTRGCQ